METPYDIKNKGNDVQEKPKVKHEKGEYEKEKTAEIPSQDIENKDIICSCALRDDAQKKSKVELKEGEYEKEKIVEKESLSQKIIKIEGDDAQEKLKVEYEEEEYEKEKIVEIETPSQDISNKGDDAQEKPKVEHEEEGDDIETPFQDIIKGDDAQENSKVEYEEERDVEKKKCVVREDLAVRPKPPSKRDPPKMQTDNKEL